MTFRPRSLTELAGIFKHLDGYTPESELAIQNRLRVFQRDGHIVPEIEGGAGYANSSKYGLKEIFKARLLLPLRDRNVPFDVAAAAFNRLVDAKHDLPAIDGCYPPMGLDALIFDIEHSDWIADFIVIEDGNIGSVKIAGEIRRREIRETTFNNRDYREQRRSAGLVTSGVWVDATNLLRPLLQYLNETNDKP